MVKPSAASGTTAIAQFGGMKRLRFDSVGVGFDVDVGDGYAEWMGWCGGGDDDEAGRKACERSILFKWSAMPRRVNLGD